MQGSEYRRREAEILFGIELLLHDWGLSDFAFDEEGQVFRDRRGTVVLGPLYADRERLLGHQGTPYGGNKVTTANIGKGRPA